MIGMVVALGPVERAEDVLVALAQVAWGGDDIAEVALRRRKQPNIRSPCSWRVGSPVDGPPR